MVKKIVGEEVKHPEGFIRPDYFRESNIRYSGGDLPWQWEEGELTVTRSAAWSAPGCHDGCGALVYTDKNGRLVKVEGDEDSPYYNGRLCVRCLALPEVEYHEDRILYPMKRDPKDRGKNKWERISWDEAYDTIEAKFRQYAEEFGPESVIFSMGTGRGTQVEMCRLAYSYGSPNYAYFQSGAACYVPRVMASTVLMGTYTTPDLSQYFIDRYDHPGWRAPKHIVIWGNQPLASNADGNMGHWVVDAMKRGSKLIVVDPRLTWLASKADLWLQLRPGTDAALAMAVGNYIIENDLYDHEFVENWCYGFEQYAERVAPYTVEKASEITWVPEEKIRRMAHMIAEKPTAFQWGLAIDQVKECVGNAQSVVSLWAITGQLDIPGGQITVHQPFNYEGYNPVDPKQFLSDEVLDKRIGGKGYPLFEYSGVVITQPDVTLDTMITGDPYPIKANWIQSSNPLACTMQDPKKMMRAYNSAEFNVVLDLFWTPTIMACGDMVLPITTWAARDGMRGVYYHLQATNKAVKTVGECKSDLEICYELGRRFNKDAWPGETIQEFLTWTLKETGMTFDEARAENWTYPEYEYEKFRKGKQRGDGQVGFNTPTGRVELYSTIFEMWNLDPLPFYEEPEESPFSRPDLMAEYPLVLTTGARRWPFFHSEHRQIPHLRAIHPDPLVELHPEAAAKYGIEDGDWCWVESSLGRVKLKAKLTVGIDPRVANADHAWWYPERDPERLYDVFDVNVNVLEPAGHFGRNGMGSNSKAMICKVYKAEDEVN
ncbi:MAG: molybdopterin-dependent oxidoreductase [Coriobacteriia bacterium]